MDGAGPVRILLTITLPLLVPHLLLAALLRSIDSFKIFIQTPSSFTLPTFIATLITEDETFWGRLMAIGLIASLPILLLLALFQKHLVRGLAGGLK